MLNFMQGITFFNLLGYVLIGLIIYKVLIKQKPKRKTLAKLRVGDKAPEFTGKDQDGNITKLSDFKGKKTILYFYPKDNTPNCTIQACNLRDYYTELQSTGYEIIGISTDSVVSHKEFIKTHTLPFRLVTDQDYVIAKQYGVWVELFMEYGYSSRKTFIIDEKGNIQHIIHKVKAKDHAPQILGWVQAL